MADEVESDDDTRELVQRASQGDELAIDSLMELHLPGLRAFVAKRMGGVVEAREAPSDVVQSVCREALEKVERFRYDGENGFRRWLYASALRKIKDRYRYWNALKRDAGREVDMRDTPSGSNDPRIAEFFKTVRTPSRDVALNEELQALEQVFEELPANYRDIILLAHVDGLPHAQIAEQLGITESHSRVLLSRALARLARLMRGKG